MMLNDLELGRRFIKQDEAEAKEKFHEENGGQELEYAAEPEPEEYPPIKGRDSVMSRMAQWVFTKEQCTEAQNALADRMPESEILKFFYPDISAEEMKRARMEYRETSA